MNKLSKYRIVLTDGSELPEVVSVLGEAKILGGTTEALMHFHGKNLDRNGAVVQRLDPFWNDELWMPVAKRVDGSWVML